MYNTQMESGNNQSTNQNTRLITHKGIHQRKRDG